MVGRRAELMVEDVLEHGRSVLRRPQVASRSRMVMLAVTAEAAAGSM